MYKNLLIVAAGGALGSIARFLIYVIYPKNNFPVNTLIINIAGSFVIGLLYAISLKQNNISETTLLFWATGICGGFTTFSTPSIRKSYSSCSLYNNKYNRGAFGLLAWL